MAQSAELTQTVQAPWGGYDVTTPDNQLPANKCRTLRNFLSGRPGRVTLRGPLYRPTGTDSAVVGGPTTWSGGWVYGDKLLHVDMRSATAGFMVTDWAPSTPTLSAKVNPAGLNTGLYPFHTRGGNFVYGYTAGSAGTPFVLYSPNRRTQNGSASASDARLMYWDGGSAAGSFVLYGASHHPYGAVDIKTFLNRLWVLGGTTPGTTTPQFLDRLYYSIDLGDGTSVLPDAVSSWQTGGTNNTVQLEGTPNDYAVALATLNGRLVILRRQSTYMLTGTSPTNFQIRKIAGVGCLDPGSVLEWDDGIFFLSDNGLVFFDGAEVHTFSAPINDEIFQAINQGSVSVELSIARLGAEHFIMCATGAPSLFPQLTAKCWVCHVPSQSWMELTADTNVLNNDSSGVPRRVMRVTNYPIVYDGAYLYDATYVPTPELSDPAVAGHDRSARGAFNYVIPGLVRSRVIRMGAPNHKSNVMRLWTEYRLKSQPGQSFEPIMGFTADSVAGPLNGSPGPYGLQGVQGLSDTKRVQPARITKSLRFMGTVAEFSLIWAIDSTTMAAGIWPVYCEIYDSSVMFALGAVNEP